MEKKKIVAIWATAIFTIAFGVLTFSNMHTITGTSASLAETMNYGNYVLVYKNGELVSWAKNTVTNIGLNHTRDALMGRLADSTVTNVSVLQLSTDAGAPSATDTTCASAITGNGLDAALGTATEQTSHHGNYSLNVTWTATGTQANVKKVCLHNSTVTGKNITFATSALSSTVNMENTDTLTVYYYVKQS